MIDPRLVLKVSRPGLWFQTLWLFLMPMTARLPADEPALWLGLVYVGLPLNLLVYAWNDRADVELDARNPRKDSWLFGARAGPEDLGRIFRLAVVMQLPFALLFALAQGPRLLAWFVAVFLVNATYNLRIGGLRGRPPLDLLNPLGYLLVAQLPVELGLAAPLPMATWLYLAGFVLQAQLIGEIMDIEPDRAGGRRTTATLLGVGPAKLLVMSLVAGLGGFCVLHFQDPVLGGFLLLGAGWLLFDLLVYARDRQSYSRTEHTLAGVGMNVAGLLSMLWLFHSQSLLRG